MVKRADPQDAHSSRATAIESVFLRQASAVAMIILLYTAATPFQPVVWLTSSLEGAFLLDRLVAGTLLFASLYFQWQIAGQTAPVAIYLPTGSRTTISDGKIRVTGGDLVWLYQPAQYWMYFVAEAALLLVAEWGGVEYLRRALVVAVVAALWAVGWSVTPQRVKREAWEYLKMIWFWIALDEIMRVGSRGAGRRRRW